MAKKRETGLVKRIRSRLSSEFKCFFFKVHGNEYQQAGIPDLVGCCAGIFFGLEVKLPKTGKVSDVQEEVMREIKRKGGGYCAVVTSPEEAVAFVRRVLRKEGRLPQAIKASSETRRRILLRARGKRPPLQTKARKNLHSGRRRRKA